MFQLDPIVQDAMNQWLVTRPRCARCKNLVATPRFDASGSIICYKCYERYVLPNYHFITVQEIKHLWK